MAPEGAHILLYKSINQAPNLCYIVGLVPEATLISIMGMVPALMEPPRKREIGSNNNNIVLWGSLTATWRMQVHFNLKCNIMSDHLALELCILLDTNIFFQFLKPIHNYIYYIISHKFLFMNFISLFKYFSLPFF